MTCQFWSHDNSLCYLHNSQDFGNYVNILSAALSVVAVILEFIILFFVKDLELYGDGANFEQIGVELQPITRPTNGTDGIIHFYFEFLSESIKLKCNSIAQLVRPLNQVNRCFLSQKIHRYKVQVRVHDPSYQHPFERLPQVQFQHNRVL